MLWRGLLPILGDISDLAFTRPRASTRRGVTTAGAGIEFFGNGIEDLSIARDLAGDLFLELGDRRALHVEAVRADVGDLTGIREAAAFSS